MLAFKFLKEEHYGESLARAFIEILEDYEISQRLLGITADNASNNSTMMAYLKHYYHANFPEAGFSVSWNQIEIMAHVINLGASEILKKFKQPIENETYEPGSLSTDRMVTALSRLAFLIEK